MIGMIKKAFIDNLPNLEWMDDKTRRAAVGKVSDEIDVSEVYNKRYNKYTARHYYRTP